jgi:hypothetical protein
LTLAGQRPLRLLQAGFGSMATDKAASVPATRHDDTNPFGDAHLEHIVHAPECDESGMPAQQKHHFRAIPMLARKTDSIMVQNSDFAPF